MNESHHIANGVKFIKHNNLDFQTTAILVFVIT